MVVRGSIVSLELRFWIDLGNGECAWSDVLAEELFIWGKLADKYIVDSRLFVWWWIQKWWWSCWTSKIMGDGSLLYTPSYHSEWTVLPVIQFGKCCLLCHPSQDVNTKSVWEGGKMPADELVCLLVGSSFRKGFDVVGIGRSSCSHRGIIPGFPWIPTRK